MGYIASSSTVTATAYLTELGRQYLQDQPSKPRYVTLANGQTIDRLKIERFSLGDPDVNYNLPLLLETGDIPDLSGENEECVTGAKGRTLNNLISPGESNIPSDDITNVTYQTTQKQITYNTQSAPNLIPTVVTQQLMTYIDGLLVNDGVYIVTPTNYGPNKLQNNELLIVLREPSSTQDGYRLRIIFPTTGSNYNKITFQYEKSTTQTGVLTTQVAQVITNPTPANNLNNTNSSNNDQTNQKALVNKFPSN